MLLYIFMGCLILFILFCSYSIFMLFSPMVDWRIIETKYGYYLVQYLQKYCPFWQSLADCELIKNKCGEILGTHSFDVKFDSKEKASYYMEYYKNKGQFPPEYNKEII